MYRLSDYRVLRTMSTPPDEIPYGVRMLGAHLEWAESKGKGMKVAVLDTGRPQHPDLKVVASYASPKLINSSSDLDRNGHATHVCGTICANGRIKGVAPEAELYTAKVLDDTGMGNDDTITDGVYWAIDKGVDVINMSLGGPKPQPKLQKALEYAVSLGITVVCAVGNSGHEYLAYPAAFDFTIGVGGVDKEKAWVDFSSVGDAVDVCALVRMSTNI